MIANNVWLFKCDIPPDYPSFQIQVSTAWHKSHSTSSVLKSLFTPTLGKKKYLGLKETCLCLQAAVKS